MSIYPGSLYFDKEYNEKLEILRYINNETISVNSSTRGQVKMSTKDILKDYILLKPDMIFSFSIVTLSGTKIKDVIVSMLINKEGETEPYCVCRQCITDLFANQLVKGKKEYYGVSVSRDTCPTNVDYSIMFTCDGIIYNTFVAGYIGISNLDGILKYLNIDKYDSILSTDYEDHVRYFTNSNDISFMYKSYMKDDVCNGYCKTLKNLLIYNNFMFDVYKGLNIIPMDLNNLEELSKDAGCLSIEDMNYLSYMVRKNINKTYVIKYDKSIDMNKISKEYIMVVDKTDNVYIILIDHSGTYTVPINESTDNIITMNNIMTKAGKADSNITQAYNKILFNQDKYDK